MQIYGFFSIFPFYPLRELLLPLVVCLCFVIANVWKCVNLMASLFNMFNFYFHPLCIACRLFIHHFYLQFSVNTSILFIVVLLLLLFRKPDNVTRRHCTEARSHTNSLNNSRGKIFFTKMAKNCFRNENFPRNKKKTCLNWTHASRKSGNLLLWFFLYQKTSQNLKKMLKEKRENPVLLVFHSNFLDLNNNFLIHPKIDFKYFFFFAMKILNFMQFNL